MALQKSIQTKFGATVSYWKIRNVTVFYSYTDTVRVTLLLDGFLTSDTRQQNYNPIETKVYEIENPYTWTIICGTDGKNNTADNPIKMGYEWIKANIVEFTDAVDV